MLSICLLGLVHCKVARGAAPAGGALPVAGRHGRRDAVRPEPLLVGGPPVGPGLGAAPLGDPEAEDAGVDDAAPDLVDWRAPATGSFGAVVGFGARGDAGPAVGRAGCDVEWRRAAVGAGSGAGKSPKPSWRATPTVCFIRAMMKSRGRSPKITPLTLKSAAPMIAPAARARFAAAAPT